MLLNNLQTKRVYLWSTLRLVIGQKVVAELRTVEHACVRLGRGGEGFGDKAVEAGWSSSRGGRLWRLVPCAINRRLLREAFVRQKIGLDSILSGGGLGCGQIRRIDQNAQLTIVLL